MKKFFFPFFTALSISLILTGSVLAQKFAVSKDEKNGDTRARIITEETKAKPSINVFDLEKLAFDLINRHRTSIGLTLLNWSDDAAKVARLHSKNMAENKFFSHRGLDGLMIGDRADSLGLKKWSAIGENIAFNRGYEHPTEFAVECWLKSEGHRQNLLNNRWKETGVGIAIAADGSYYFTQVFLLRK